MYKINEYNHYVLNFSQPPLKDFAASLLDGRLWFGKYPTLDEIGTILGSGFTHIINLCTPDEITWEPYRLPWWITKVDYPFEDGSKQKPLSESSLKPQEWNTFIPFILGLVSNLSRPETRMYVHCLGGHGRSATIAAVMCSIIENKEATLVLKEVREAHQRRKVMLEKWRKLGAPQRRKQKQIVRYFADDFLNKDTPKPRRLNLK